MVKGMTKKVALEFCLLDVNHQLSLSPLDSSLAAMEISQTQDVWVNPVWNTRHIQNACDNEAYQAIYVQSPLCT